MVSDIQLSMFPELVPDHEMIPETKEAKMPVQVRAGWRLLTSTRGLLGWHRIKHASVEHSMIAHCGEVGVPVATPYEYMDPCPDCLATE